MNQDPYQLLEMAATGYPVRMEFKSHEEAKSQRASFTIIQGRLRRREPDSPILGVRVSLNDKVVRLERFSDVAEIVIEGLD